MHRRSRQGHKLRHYGLPDQRRVSVGSEEIRYGSQHPTAY